MKRKGENYAESSLSGRSVMVMDDGRLVLILGHLAAADDIFELNLFRSF